MDISYQALQVKQYDRDRYICCLFASEEARAKLFTILSFNSEVAAILTQTSELTPALIRITWWQDAIDDLYNGKVSQHSLIQSLNLIIDKIPHKLIAHLMHARMLELYQNPIHSIDELVVFAEETGANLLEIMALSLGIQDSERYRPLGIAWALLGNLRSPEYLRLEKLNKDIIKSIIGEIQKYLAMMDSKLFSKSTAAIDLLYYLAKYYLRLIIKADYDIYSDKLKVNPVIKQLYLSYRYLML
jgi:hypothetical protein